MSYETLRSRYNADGEERSSLLGGVQSFVNEHPWRTKLLLEDGREEVVEELYLEGVEPSPMSSDTNVFLSHTNRDDIKEHIARPTHWFLNNVLGVRAFIDDGDLMPGQDRTQALMEAAHECTIAVVFLSPSFRKRRFCVLELNTFMRRFHEQDGIRVIPAPWHIDNVDGYNSKVDELIRISQPEESHYVLDYLVHFLWPALIKELGLREMETQELEDHLRNYVESLQGGRVSVPTFFNVFARRNRSRGADMLNIPGPAPVRREMWYGCLLDLNVRTIELRCPEEICGTTINEINFTERVVEGGLRAQASHFGRATLSVGSRPTNID